MDENINEACIIPINYDWKKELNNKKTNKQQSTSYYQDKLEEYDEKQMKYMEEQCLKNTTQEEFFDNMLNLPILEM